MQTKFKQMHDKSKRITALLLAIAMVFSAVPVSVFAAETPFISVTTADGAAVKVIEQDAVNYDGGEYGGQFDDVPYYHVQIPEGTESVKVTYPEEANVGVYTDGQMLSFGYYAETEGWTGGGLDLAYVANADGSVTIEVPVKYTFFDWMTMSDVEVDFSSTHAYGVQSSSFNPINFFTFEYVEAVEEPEVPGKLHTKITANGKELAEEDVVYQSGIDFTSKGGMTFDDVPYYTVNVPQGAEKVVVTYEGNNFHNDGLDVVTSATISGYSADVAVTAEGAVTLKNPGGPALQATGDNETYTSVEIPVADYVLTEGEDGTKTGKIISGQTSEFAPVEFFSFVYTGEAVQPSVCVSVADDAPQAVEVGAGGLYEISLGSVFTDSEGHSLSYSYEVAEDGYSDQHTKIANGKFYFSAPDIGSVFNVTLTAKCSGGEEVSHKIAVTITKPNEGLEEQYGYDETPKSSVNVYVTIANDGMPVMAADGTIMSGVEVTVPYFDLGLYGMEHLYRYGTENGQGKYVNDNIVQRPTGFHLYIYLLERYYMGLEEDQCCLGTSGVLDYYEDTQIFYMNGDLAYENETKSALRLSGGATSIYMVNFWGHDENLMYFRNHCYPYMSPGWGSTSDYILLSDGDTWEVGMFSDWNFHQKNGGFLRFDENEYRKNAGDTFTVKTLKWGTVSTCVDFEVVDESVGIEVALYDSEWNHIKDIEYTGGNELSVTLDADMADGTYYLMAKDPNACTDNAKFTPGVSRIIVGEEETGGDVVEVSRILFDKYEATIDTTKTLQITAAITPSEATDKTLTWTSSDESVATVDADGLVTPVKPGNTTIKATSSNGKSASCEVTVTRFNTAPETVGGIDTTIKMKSGETKEFVVADLFRDAQNDELTFTADVQKAVSVQGNYMYNYQTIAGWDNEVKDGVYTFAPTEKGLYKITFSANDGMATTRYGFTFTVVDNDAGTLVLEGGAVMDITNVVVVDSSVEFVEDYVMEFGKGTHDTYIHRIVLANGIPNSGIQFDITADSGVSVEQRYGSSAGMPAGFRGNFDFFVCNTSTGEEVWTAHRIELYTQCVECVDADNNHVCDRCTMKLESDVVYGDIDGGGSIDMLDVSCVLQYVNGSELTEAQAEACDVDGNGSVDMLDVSYLLQYVNGIIDKFPAEE